MARTADKIRDFSFRAAIAKLTLAPTRAVLNKGAMTQGLARGFAVKDGED